MNPTNGQTGRTLEDLADPTVSLLAQLRKQKARITEYEQIAGEAQAALVEARRTYALAQKAIARELGLDSIAADAVPTKPPRAKFHRRSYKAVLAALSDGNAATVDDLQSRTGLTPGATSGACHRLVAYGDAKRIGKGIYQAVKS
jgi:hypothetical protein